MSLFKEEPAPPQDPLKWGGEMLATVDPNLEITIADYEAASKWITLTPVGSEMVKTQGSMGKGTLTTMAFERKWQMRAWTAERQEAEAIVQERGPDNALIYEKPGVGFYVYLRRPGQ